MWDPIRSGITTSTDGKIDLAACGLGPDLRKWLGCLVEGARFELAFTRVCQDKGRTGISADRKRLLSAFAAVDTTAQEVWYFFNERAMAVYRNRKLENPTGLMLSTVRDWFPARRVQERRIEIKKAEEESAKIQREMAEHLAELRAETASRMASGRTEHSLSTQANASTAHSKPFA